jgi:hypothetical protein
MTAAIISFRTGRTVTPGHVAVLAEVLSRDGCRCGLRDVYVVLDSLQAFDCLSGEAMGVVPADTVPLGVSSRIVLDVAYPDGNPANVWKRGRRPNVVTLCQVCAQRHEDDAILKRWRGHHVR